MLKNALKKMKERDLHPFKNCSASSSLSPVTPCTSGRSLPLTTSDALLLMNDLVCIVITLNNIESNDNYYKKNLRYFHSAVFSCSSLIQASWSILGKIISHLATLIFFKIETESCQVWIFCKHITLHLYFS